MAVTVKIARLLPDYKIELSMPGSQHTRTVTLAYITSPNGNSTSWTTACSLKPGDDVGFKFRYSGGGDIFCDLLTPRSLLEDLLGDGLAVIRPDADLLQGFVPWSSQLQATWSWSSQLRACQALAQVWREGFWKTWQPSVVSTVAIGTHSMDPSGVFMWRFDSGLCEMTKHVILMVSAVCFVIFKGDDRRNRFHVSSIQIPPSMATRAEEFLRPKLAESLPPVFTFEKISCAANDVSFFGKMRAGDADTDVASMLVEHGLAVPDCSKSDPDLLTPYERSLLELQAIAIREKRGMYRNSPSLSAGLNSTSETDVTAALSRLRDQTRIPAKLVEITSGGFLNLEILTERIVLALLLARVWVPRVEEPFGKEALEFITSTVSGDVEISIESTDTDGRCFGDVYLPNNPDSLSVTLVKQGLADVRQVEAQAQSERQHDRGMLESAKKVAVNAQKGLWQASNPGQVERSLSEAAEESSFSGKYVDVSLSSTEINLYISRCDRKVGSFLKDVNALYGVKDGYEIEDDNGSSEGTQRFKGLAYPFVAPPNVGDHVMVLNDADDIFFSRGIVKALQEKPKDSPFVHCPYLVFLVDLGEVLEYDGSEFSPVPSQISLSNVPPFCTEIRMSFLDLPPPKYTNAGWVQDNAVSAFVARFRNQKLVARVDAPGSCPKLTLFADESNRPEDSLNWLMAREGIADVESFKTARAWAKFPQWEVVYDSLCEARNAARLEGNGIWKP